MKFSIVAFHSEFPQILVKWIAPFNKPQESVVVLFSGKYLDTHVIFIVGLLYN